MASDEQPSVWQQWLADNIGAYVRLHYYDRETVAGVLESYDASHVSLVSQSTSGKRLYTICASLSEVRYMMVQVENGG